jgi:hypothetical protein
MLGRYDARIPANLFAVHVRPRTPVWPAYLVAAFCFLVAIVTTLINLNLTSQARQLQVQATRSDLRATSLARRLAAERTALADLQNPRALRYDVPSGQVVVSNDHLYIVMHDMPMPPHGKVYQAWTLARGARAMSPSVTFIPDNRGIAVVALQDVAAAATEDVAVSVEPEAGSRSPTTSLLFEVQTQ